MAVGKAMFFLYKAMFSSAELHVQTSQWFDSSSIVFCVHSCMIALGLITSGMSPSKCHNKSAELSWETHEIVPFAVAPWTLANLWGGSFVIRHLTEVVRFCFSLPKAEKTGLVLFPWNIWLDSQSQFWFFNCDIFFSSRYIFVHHDLLKSSQYRNRIKKGIAIFYIIVLSPKLTSYHRT